MMTGSPDAAARTAQTAESRYQVSDGVGQSELPGGVAIGECF